MWVKIDDRFYQHPKIVEVGPLGLALQVAGLCYCNQYLTDGFVPKGVARRLMSWDEIVIAGERVSSEKIIESLLSAGIWDDAPGGYQIHNYGNFQKSRAEGRSIKESRRKAGRAGGIKSGEARRDKSEASNEANDEAKPKQTPKQGAKQNEENCEAESNPVPVPVPVPDPVPVPISKEGTSDELALAVDPPGNLDGKPQKPKKKRRVINYTDKFQAFWKIYPRREDKIGAFEEWKAVEDIISPIDELQAILSQQAKSKAAEGISFPHAVRWLKKQRWLDEPTESIVRETPQQRERRKQLEAADRRVREADKEENNNGNGIMRVEGRATFHGGASEDGDVRQPPPALDGPPRRD